MKKCKPIALLTLSFLLPLIGCSTTPPPPAQEVHIKELSLFLSRRSLSGTEFEQYKLGEDGSLYIECGKIRGGRFIPIFQKMDRLHTAKTQEINTALAKLITTTPYEKGSFDSPGNNSSLFDPGKYTLTFSGNSNGAPLNGKVATSLDATTEPSSGATKALFQIAKATRTGVSFYDPICDNRSFYGLPGRTYPHSNRPSN